MKRIVFGVLVVFALAVACKSKTSEAPAKTPGTVQAPPAAVGPSVSGTIAIKPELVAKIPANGVLFIFAKTSKAPGPPLAVIREPVSMAGAFPIAFSLSAKNAMMPGVPFEGNVFVTARISGSGVVMPSAGDLEGSTADAVPVGTQGVVVTLDTVR